MAAFCLHAPRQATQVGPGRQCGLIGKLTLTRPAKIMGRLLIRTCLAACLRVEQSFQLGMQFTLLLAGISSLVNPTTIFVRGPVPVQVRPSLSSSVCIVHSLPPLSHVQAGADRTRDLTSDVASHHNRHEWFLACKKGRPAGHVFHKQRLPGTRVGIFFCKCP